MNHEVAMTIHTESLLIAILIITTFSLGTLVFAQAPTPEIVGDINTGQMSNNSITSNSNNLMANAEGRISSAQNDGNNTWITWGKWALVSKTSEGLQNDSSPLFNATITSVKSDNTERHKHQIHDFKLTSSSISNNGKFTILTLGGTASISTKGEQFLQVPMRITITGSGTGNESAANNTERNPSWAPIRGTISILIDDTKSHSHFGSTPIYGYLVKPKVP